MQWPMMATGSKIGIGLRRRGERLICCHSNERMQLAIECRNPIEAGSRQLD